MQLLGHWENWRVTMSPRETTFVLPFYLSMMCTNATAVGERVWDDLVVVDARPPLMTFSGCSVSERGGLLSWALG